MRYRASLIQNIITNLRKSTMNKNTIAIAFVLAVGVLSFAAAVIPLVYAQSLPLTGESETETEQEIKQKNVCSGWAVRTNIAEIDKPQLRLNYFQLCRNCEYKLDAQCRCEKFHYESQTHHSPTSKLLT
jgi:hypothetical protein